MSRHANSTLYGNTVEDLREDTTNLFTAGFYKKNALIAHTCLKILNMQTACTVEKMRKRVLPNEALSRCQLGLYCSLKEI